MYPRGPILIGPWSGRFLTNYGKDSSSLVMQLSALILAMVYVTGFLPTRGADVFAKFQEDCFCSQDNQSLL